MVVIGAKGHAKEILDILEKNNLLENILFYDDVSSDNVDFLFNRFKILKNINEFKSLKDKRFILGLGNVKLRNTLFEKFINAGGKPFSVISKSSTIGKYNVNLGNALNIMHYVSIFNNTKICDGTLINSFVSVHHDSTIGCFCEISPGARILGRVKIGNYTSIGSNAVILPDIVVGNNVIIGAGAVVTKNVPDNEVWGGVPAKKLK